MKRLFLTACLILLSLSSILAVEDSIFYLGEIIVTPDEEKGLVGPSIVEVTSQDIEDKNADTVAEALDGLRGIFVSVGSKNEPDIKLRGISQDKILVLIDGFPVSGPYYGYVNLNQIPTENIAKIKVIKGPSSTLYGPNSMGGVINIITKESLPEPFTTLGLDLATYNTCHFEFAHGETKDKFSFLASGSFRQSDGFTLSDSFEGEANEDGGKRENSDYNRKACSLKLGLRPGDDDSFALSFNYIDNEEGIPYHTGSSEPRYWRFAEWKKWNLAFMEDMKLGPKASLKGRIFYDKYDNILESYDDASLSTQTRRYAFTSTYDDYGVGGSLHPAVSLGDSHLLKGALHFKADVHKEQPDLHEEWEEYRAKTYSVGLEDEIDLKKNFSLTLGGSVDGFHIEERDMDSPNFCLRTEYDAGDNQYWIALGQKSRFPTLHQLYSSYSGNLDLKEEKALNSELGLARRWSEKNRTTFTLFASRVRDLIEREGKYDPYLNIAKATFEGVETEFETELNRHNRVIFGYTYLTAREKTGSTERELRYTPRHQAYAKLSGRTQRGLSYHLAASYVGKRYWYDEEIQEELPHYCLVNARITKKLAGYSEVFVSIDNLLDEDYEEEDGFPQSGRTIWVGMKSEF